MTAKLFLKWAALTALAMSVFGCKSLSPTHLTGKAIEGVGSLVEHTSVAVIETSGHVAVSTIKATAQVSGRITSQTAAVTFVTITDTTTGISRRIPYSDGLRLYAASQYAKVAAGLQAFQLVRNGVMVMKANWSGVKPGSTTNVVLQPGDIVRLSSLRRA